MPEPTSLTFNLLPEEIRQSSAIGAEVHLPPGMNLLELDNLTEKDKETLRQALFENQVIVIRKQKGVDATVLPNLAKIFDPSASDIHSAGEKAVSDPKNILSAYKAGRHPQAAQVGIIGSGKFQDYEGLKEIEVVHLVSLPCSASNAVLIQCDRITPYSTRLLSLKMISTMDIPVRTDGTWTPHSTSAYPAKSPSYTLSVFPTCLIRRSSSLMGRKKKLPLELQPVSQELNLIFRNILTGKC